MEHTTLKKWRLVVPGILIAVLSIPLFVGPGASASAYASWVSFLARKLPYAFIVIGGGMLYNALRLRDSHFFPSIQRIRQNLQNDLVDAGACDPTIASHADTLRTDSRVVDSVFYGIVDNDKTLSLKSRNVYMNGLLLSSAADFCVVGGCLSVIYFLAYLLTKTDAYALISMGLVVGYGFTLYHLMPHVEAKHIELGSLQVSHIETHKSNDLRVGLISLLPAAPK